MKMTRLFNLLLLLATLFVGCGGTDNSSPTHEDGDTDSGDGDTSSVDGDASTGSPTEGSSDSSGQLSLIVAPWTDDDNYAPDPRWLSDQDLGNNTADKFAGIYSFENLTIGDNVNIYSKGISQLVLKVKGKLTLGKNVRIQVRNGYYSVAPSQTISSLTAGNLVSKAITYHNVLLFKNTYGQGGNGGAGGIGDAGKTWKYYYSAHDYELIEGHGGSGGGGGGGGFGGGKGGLGASGAYGPGGNGYDGHAGEDNGGDGGYGGANDITGTGGGAEDIGKAGSQSQDKIGAGGGGGGGNAGDGVFGGTSEAMWGGGGGTGGRGGGGGGYGGGVLYIAAKTISYDKTNPPQFIVSGQVGGLGATKGSNGQGGLLVIFTTTEGLDSSLWTPKSELEAESNKGGHGTVLGGPQKIFVNPVLGNDSSSPDDTTDGDAASGTWTDTTTGYMWQEPPKDDMIPWADAQEYCSNLLLGGYSDWRLPTIDELRTLVRDCKISMPGGLCGVTESCLDSDYCYSKCGGCDANGGGGSDGCYWPTDLSGICGACWWSSSVDTGSRYKWTVCYIRGHVQSFFEEDNLSVRCVR